jgi:hypothetical protein
VAKIRNNQPIETATASILPVSWFNVITIIAIVNYTFPSSFEKRMGGASLLSNFYSNFLPPR